MAFVDIGCPACGRTLRVAEEHLGKQIRCPACQQISIASGKAGNAGADVAAAEEGAASDATTWHVRMPEGPIYGPIAWSEVESWAAEGRIVADCELSESGAGPWRRAAEWLPHLAASSAPSTGPAAPTSYPWTGAGAGQVGGLPSQNIGAAPQGLGYVAPHRGGLILVLGLLGFMGVCPIFSFLAWIMGSHDLREMRAGRMDKSGEGPTVAGMVFGMIVSVIWIFGAVVLSIIVLITIAANL